LNQAAAAIKQTENLNKLKTTLTSLGKSLAQVSDGATADKAKATLMGLVAPLQAQLAELSKLGDGDGSLVAMKDTLMKAATTQVNSLMSNAEVKKAVGPVLEQIKSALAGK
jgi:hypothetical protein